ncbi:MAG: CDP-alcohol phosphatidyltransferase family protein [Coprothermobacterota bacterium]|nr:CDP-alcohol phosphatidyltransferase family protein [Coprothermobacterota bacterium]
MLTIPNLLTIFRLAAVTPLVIFILARNSLAAFLVILLATFSDYLDGYLARRFKQESRLGKILDPTADKLLGGAAFISLCIAQYLPWSIFALFAARDLILLITMFILTAQHKRILTETKIGKFSTGLFMLSLALVVIEVPYAILLFYICFAIYLYTGAIYVIRIFQTPEGKELKEEAKRRFRKHPGGEGVFPAGDDQTCRSMGTDLKSVPMLHKAILTVDTHTYLRIPIRTHEIKPPDSLQEQVARYAGKFLQSSDTLVLSEKMVAATQNRLVPSESIHPTRLAVWLAGKVTKTPHGIGLGSPLTMQLALRECGTWRILLAAAFGAVGKLLGIKGLFYRVAGRQAAWIDGDAPYGMLRGHAVLGPKEPARVCQEMDQLFGCRVAVLDVNDIGGCEICGASRGADKRIVLALMKDNPLGQDVEQTPIGILRLLDRGPVTLFHSR